MKPAPAGSGSSRLAFAGSLSGDPLPPIAANYLAADAVSLPWASVVLHKPLAPYAAFYCAQLVPFDPATDQLYYVALPPEEDGVSGVFSLESVRSRILVAAIMIVYFVLLGCFCLCYYWSHKCSADPRSDRRRLLQELNLLTGDGAGEDDVDYQSDDDLEMTRLNPRGGGR